MLLNEIGYEMYLGPRCNERRPVRRQSWPRFAERVPSAGTGSSMRLALGRALISLGRAIAAERPVSAPASAARH